MNRAILAGSVIVGIAVMMSISMIAPAFAANPWKDLYTCVGTQGERSGTFDWLTGEENECSDLDILEDRMVCPTKSGADGHKEFKDIDRDGEFQDPEEQTRCHKTSFWT